MLPSIRKAACWLTCWAWGLISDHEFHSLGKVVRFFSQFCFLEFCQIVHQICSSCALFFCLATEGFRSQLSRPLFCSKVTLWPPKNVKFLLCFFFFLNWSQKENRNKFPDAPYWDDHMILLFACVPAFVVCLASTLYAFGRGITP